MKKVPYGKYTTEFREEAVRLATDSGLSVAEAARRLSLPKSTLENWVKKYRAGELENIRESRQPLTAIEQELAKVKREFSPDKNGAGSVKKSGSVLCKTVAVKYAMIKKLRHEFPIIFMCRVFHVSSSGYYSWRRPSNYRRQREDLRLEAEILAAHRRTRGTFGPERLQKHLADYGVHLGIYRIKRIRKKLGIRCKQKKKFKATTNSKHSLPVVPNILEQEFTFEKPNEAWVTDISYIPTGEGWLYLAGHKDLCTGEIVGYAMSAGMTKALISQSL